MRKFYSVELNKQDAEYLKVYLKKNDIYYEPSSCYNLIHFEVKASKEELHKINQFLNALNS